MAEQKQKVMERVVHAVLRFLGITKVPKTQAPPMQRMHIPAMPEPPARSSSTFSRAPQKEPSDFTPVAPSKTDFEQVESRLKPAYEFKPSVASSFEPPVESRGSKLEMGVKQAKEKTQSVSPKMGLTVRKKKRRKKTLRKKLMESMMIGAKEAMKKKGKKGIERKVRMTSRSPPIQITTVIKRGVKEGATIHVPKGANVSVGPHVPPGQFPPGVSFVKQAGQSLKEVEDEMEVARGSLKSLERDYFKHLISQEEFMKRASELRLRVHQLEERKKVLQNQINNPPSPEKEPQRGSASNVSSSGFSAGHAGFSRSDGGSYGGTRPGFHADSGDSKTGLGSDGSKEQTGSKDESSSKIPPINVFSMRNPSARPKTTSQPIIVPVPIGSISSQTTGTASPVSGSGSPVTLGAFPTIASSSVPGTPPIVSSAVPGTPISSASPSVPVFAGGSGPVISGSQIVSGPPVSGSDSGSSNSSTSAPLVTPGTGARIVVEKKVPYNPDIVSQSIPLPPVRLPGNQQIKLDAVLPQNPSIPSTSTTPSRGPMTVPKPDFSDRNLEQEFEQANFMASRGQERERLEIDRIKRAMEEKLKGKVDDEQLRKLSDNMQKLLEAHVIEKDALKRQIEQIDSNRVVESFVALVRLIENQIPKTETIRFVPEEMKDFADNRKKEPLHLKQTELENKELITDYDKILDEVRKKGKISMDELSKLAQVDKKHMKEILIVLEKEGLVEIKYPAFGQTMVVDAIGARRKKEADR